MKFLNKYIKKHWKLFCLAVVFLSIEATCDLVQPTIMAKIIDKGVGNKDMTYVINMGCMMLLVVGIGAVAACSRNILASTVSQKFGMELRYDLFRKIQGFSFDNIDRFERASLITRLTNDVTQVQNFANGLMRIFVKAPILCVGALIMAVRLNIALSTILAIVVPAVIIVIIINMKVGYPFFIKVQKALDKVNGVMREYLSGVRVVKAFNRFEYEVDRFNISNLELSGISIKSMRVMAIFGPTISLIVNLGIVAVLWIGGIRVNNGQAKAGEVIAFINYMTQILFSLMIISNVFTMFVRARASVERIGEVFEEENTMNVRQEKPNNKGTKDKIRFENVSFKYRTSSGEFVLKNLSFTAKQGETIGIIGSTGAGKSTLVNLIPRFYDASEGSVKIDGIDVKDIHIENLRKKIAIVPQKNLLFTGTIEENIRWGKHDATEEEIISVSAMAQSDRFINTFPEGYKTMLGQGGVNLSGGQKQRLAIARALIRKPDILILDDCTSAVDVNTEKKIKDALRKYSSDVTCLLIAQRITSVMDADRIIVLENGEIAGSGTHGELLNSCGIYREIFQSQIGKEMM